MKKIMMLGLLMMLLLTAMVSSELGLDWTLATASADWSPRAGHSGAVFDGKMWILGGNTVAPFQGAGTYTNDVWYSTNGINWTEATASADWNPRSYAEVIVYDNKMWILGGMNGTDYYNDVWYSSNGINWTLATDNATWPHRYDFGAVVYDGKMWVIEGLNEDYLTDVWYSTDGVNWILATSSEPGRRQECSLVHDNKMWIMGGYVGIVFMNDVLSSTDGVTWNSVRGWAPYDPTMWGLRISASATTLDGKMWISGGNMIYNYNDVWYSFNGVDWINVTMAAPWSARQQHQMLSYNNKLWIIGGCTACPYGMDPVNDVWYSEIPPLQTQELFQTSQAGAIATAVAGSAGGGRAANTQGLGVAQIIGLAIIGGVVAYNAGWIGKGSSIRRVKKTRRR
jgi:hypothetical protein